MKKGQNTVKNVLDLLWKDWNEGKSDGDVFLYWKDKYEKDYGVYVTPIGTVVKNNNKEMKLTKEEVQNRIDHYGAVSAGERAIGRMEMSCFYAGKQDAYINLYNELFPEMEKERAYPLDEKRKQKTIDFIVELHNSASKC